MKWLTYRELGDGQLELKFIESDEKPINSINGEVTNPERALALLGAYLIFDQNGVTHINREMIHRPLTWHERIRAAYLVEPMMVWFVVAALGLGLANFILIFFHLAI